MRVPVAAQMLAKILIQETKKPITLVGVGLGAEVSLRAVAYLDDAMKECGSNTNNVGSIIQNMVVLGAPVSGHGKNELWSDVRSKVAGRIINCFSNSDDLLASSPAADLLNQANRANHKRSNGNSAVKGGCGYSELDWEELAGLNRACCGLQDVLVENIDVDQCSRRCYAPSSLYDYQQKPGTLAEILYNTGIFASRFPSKKQ